VTALTVPARPGQDGVGLRPVPWRRMARVTWRQHRAALVGMAVLLGVLAVWLWTAGTSLHHAYAAATACHPANSAACNSLVDTFNGMDTFLWQTIPKGAFLPLVPPLIGAFAGAPVLARELETGTFRYAWTQGFGRWRWALAKLVLLGVLLAAAAAAFSVLVSWYFQPYFAAGNQALGLNEDSPFVVFNLGEVAYPAWTLAAFAIGALAGMLIRRVVPAILATLAAYAVLAVVTEGLPREHYLTPLASTSLNLPANVWITGQWWTRNGRFAFAGRPSMDLINQYCSFLPGGKQGGKPSSATFAQCLAQHGYTQWTGYQPASRFCTFQWIESGWLLALSALLIAATIWLVHHRAA
jgi:hypothetical protein